MERFLELSDAMPYIHAPIEAHLLLKNGHVETASTGMPSIGQYLDYSWLDQAAEHFQVSKKFADYILVPAPMVFLGAPNRNGVGYGYDDMVAYNAEMARPAFKTWVGRPTHFEHQSADPKQATGVLFDSTLQRMNAYEGNPWAMYLLHGFDRQKFPDLANQILTKRRPHLSIGAMVEKYSCSYCGVPIHPKLPDQCEHATKKHPSVKLINGKLAFAVAHNIVGHESSSVATPAFPYATGSYIKY